MSKNAYEFLDLMILTIIAAVAECLDVYAFTSFASPVFALSIACVMGLIAIFRWNVFGLVVPVAAGAAGVLTRVLLQQKVTLGLWLAFTVGYLALGIVLVWFLRRDKSALNEDKFFKYGYYFSGYFAVEFLRAVCQIGNGDFFAIVWTYYALDLLNVIFGLVVWVVACKQSHLVVDMNCYLRQIHSAPSSAVIRDEKKDAYKLEELSEASDVNDAALLDGGTLSAEDLHAMDAPLRKSEHRESRFDQENQALADYRDGKSKKGR